MTNDTAFSSGGCQPPNRIDRRFIAAALLLFAVGGCSPIDRADTWLQSKRPVPVGPTSVDYRGTHPILIDEQLHTMDIPVGLNTSRLSSPVKGNIAGFAQRFNAGDSAVMAIVSPNGSPNQGAANGVSQQVRDVLLNAGVNPEALEFRSYNAGRNETSAPIRLAYNKITAHVDNCGNWPDRLEKNVFNENYKNFGCATQANLAATVANPLDLLYPRALAPADAARRSTVLENYRKGEVYSSKQKLESGEVAEGVGN